MNIQNVSVPEIYKSSQDFRLFLKWFARCLAQIQYDTENVVDLYDSLRCKTDLLWMLADTMGYKYDDRLPPAYCRLVLLYFMSIIRNRGSKDGVTLAAEVNLAQFNIINYAKEKDILNYRLEDTSIPVNSVYVTPHTPQGYIDVVYFSDTIPIDACIEYARPLGMYCFQYAGVRYDARTKISVDARLTNTADLGVSIGPTHVGHYRRADYASIQKVSKNATENEATMPSETRNPVYYRNSTAEKITTPNAVTDDKPIDPGYRALYSLQLCNNEHIFKSLFKDKIFDIGYGPQDVSVANEDKPMWNLRYNKTNEEALGENVYTIDENRSEGYTKPRPAVNPVMAKLGDAINLNDQNTLYTKVKSDGTIVKVDEDGNEV